MPTARELLEQADALMRRNRERAARAGIPQPASEIPEVSAGIPDLAAEIPELTAEIPELTDVVTIGAPPALPTARGDVPEHVDAVEAIEIGIASIADVSDEANKLSAEPDLDRGDHRGDVPIPESVPSTPPALSESAPEPEPEPAPAPAPASTGAPVPLSAAALVPQPEPGRRWSLFSFGRKSDEPAAAISAVETVPPANEGSTAVQFARPANEGGTAVARTDGTIAAAPAVESPVREAPATNVAGVASSLSIDGTVPAASLPIDAEGSTSTPLSAVLTEDAVVPPATAKPALADDWARWEALAEEIRMQVLQRIDIFTDTGLREQLAVQLQPIVDRASAELVTTINEHVGKLIRAYIAEAIEREIETWRKGNS